MKVPTAHASRRPLQIEMTPMIDVVFLLLIFFLWTTSFQLSEELLPTKISKPIAARGKTQEVTEEADFDPIVIRILGSANELEWRINNQPVDSIDLVTQRLSAAMQIKSDVPVIVDPAPTVPLGDVIEVYDLTRQLGCEEIQFAASVDDAQ